MPLDQRHQQVEGFGSERDGLTIAQQKALCRIQTEMAEFIEMIGLMVHTHFETPPIKASATPKRKYPEYPHHAASEADHPASNQPRLRRYLSPAGSPLG